VAVVGDDFRWPGLAPGLKFITLFFRPTRRTRRRRRRMLIRAGTALSSNDRTLDLGISRGLARSPVRRPKPPPLVNCERKQGSRLLNSFHWSCGCQTPLQSIFLVFCSCVRTRAWHDQCFFERQRASGRGHHRATRLAKPCGDALCRHDESASKGNLPATGRSSDPLALAVTKPPEKILD